MEAIYAHYPGLVVMTPATVEDAYHLLLAAVKLDDPVIYCEHKFLYNHLKTEHLSDASDLPPNKARIARKGRDATIVTYSAMLHEALTAAGDLSREGWEIEVIDLRVVKPIDTETILESVSRTGRVLAVGESSPWGGVTSEVISRVAADGFRFLDAPPRRLACKDTPVPYHPNLWAAHRPNAAEIARVMRELLTF
jgi:acetoin:2,6-dichlorophenolindophenol oxidoreductase subunit beta